MMTNKTETNTRTNRNNRDGCQQTEYNENKQVIQHVSSKIQMTQTDKHTLNYRQTDADRHRQTETDRERGRQETGRELLNEVETEIVCLLVGCLTSQQQASVSQGRICSDNCTCCHTEIEVADQTFYLTQSQYTDTGPTSPSADPITPGAWQGSLCVPIFKSLV